MRIPPRVLVLFSVLTGIAPAQVINIDFNSATTPEIHSGLAAATDPAGSSAFWNGLSRSGFSDEISASGLLDSKGNATSVSLDLEISGGFSSPGDQELGGGYASLMADYVFISSLGPGLVTTSRGSISGLAPAEFYDIYFYSQGDVFESPGSQGQNGLFSVDGVEKQTGWDGIVGGDGLLFGNVEYVKFTTRANPEGRIDFLWSNVVAGANALADSDGKTSIYSALNGIQITPGGNIAIPEPSIALLGGLGLLFLLGRRP